MEPERGDGREERGEATREKLLTAARQAFAEKGYAGASVRDIAAAASVHPALVAYHFGSKQGLFQRVIDDAIATFRDELVLALSGAEDRESGARKAFAVYLDHLERNPDFPRLLLRGMLDGDDVVIEVVRRQVGPMFQLATAFRAEGGFGALDAPDQVFLSVLGATFLPYLMGRVFDGLVDDPGAGDGFARRRAHLEALLGVIVRPG